MRLFESRGPKPPSAKSHYSRSTQASSRTLRLYNFIANNIGLPWAIRAPALKGRRAGANSCDKGECCHLFATNIYSNKLRFFRTARAAASAGGGSLYSPPQAATRTFATIIALKPIATNCGFYEVARAAASAGGGSLYSPPQAATRIFETIIASKYVATNCSTTGRAGRSIHLRHAAIRSLTIV